MRSIEIIDNRRFIVVDLNFRNITSKKAFLRFMKEAFDLPTDLSDSIDSLNDYLRDLEWFVGNNESIKIRIKHLNTLKDKNKETYDLTQECLDLYKRYWDRNKLNSNNVVIFEFIS